MTSSEREDANLISMADEECCASFHVSEIERQKRSEWIHVVILTYLGLCIAFALFPHSTMRLIGGVALIPIVGVCVFARWRDAVRAWRNVRIMREACGTSAPASSGVSLLVEGAVKATVGLVVLILAMAAAFAMHDVLPWHLSLWGVLTLERGARFRAHHATWRGGERICPDIYPGFSLEEVRATQAQHAEIAPGMETGRLREAVRYL